MKLSIVVPVLNQFPLAETAIGFSVRNLSENAGADLLVIDNGSDIPFSFPKVTDRERLKRMTIRRHEKSIGVYPTFWDALPHVAGDVIAFFHSDLIITEKGWDKRVLLQFNHDPRLGLLGFIGSNELDSAGGRGLGTTSNFQGTAYTCTAYTHHDGLGGSWDWIGSPAAAHGKVSDGFSRAAVVDGCAMIFRRHVLEKIAPRKNFPPHHFYDKLLSCEVRELGYSVGVLGVACDHISGQTVNQEEKYRTMAEEWSRANLTEDKFVGNPHDWQWDGTVYREAERQWLAEYRDQKKFIPCKV